MDGVRDGAATRRVIELNEVTHVYRSLRARKVAAVENFTFEIRQGEVVGLAGPNGAGKSTLIAILLGFLRPTSGSVRIEGARPRTWVWQHGIGYVPELVKINPRWVAEHALTRYAILSRVPAREVPARVDDAIRRLGIEEHRAKRIKALSKGNLQRLGIAQALLSDSRFFVLDEPTHGLDPLWTQRFRDIVAELRRPERAVFIASHDLEELRRVCDRVAIIDRGRLQRVVELRAPAVQHAARAYRLAVAAGAEIVAQRFPSAKRPGPAEFELEPMSLAELNRAVASLMNEGVVLSAMAPARSDLEREFREAVGEVQ